MSDLIDTARTAAAEESEKHWPGTSDVQAKKRKAFIHGSAFIAGQLLGRDEIANALSTQTTCDGEPFPSELHYRQADAVLALIGGKIGAIN